jgi:hypothetical protein
VRALGWFAATTPLVVAVWRAGAAAQWRADMAAVRDQGLVAVGVGGTLSTVATQALGLLPLGTQSFRAAVAAALALAGIGHLLWRIGQRLFANGPRGWLDVGLATLASLTATLGPALQIEATIGGGATFSLFTVLLTVDLALRLTAEDARVLAPDATRRWLLLGAAAGACLAEAPAAGVVALGIVGVVLVSANRRPPLRLAPIIALVAVAVAAALAAPLFVRPLAPRAWNDVGRALSSATLGPLAVAPPREAAVVAWIHEIGLLPLALAAFGILAAAARKERRAWSALLVLPPCVDLVLPRHATPGITADPLGAVRALAVVTLTLAGALGVSEVVRVLGTLKIPLAKAVAVLTVVGYVTVAAVTAEESAFAADRSEQLAAEEWTDAALESLPLRAAVYVHAPDVAWRLWAAQLLRGERPDVLVVPAPLLQRGHATSNVLPSEPASMQLLRDVALTGRASEYALSILADARPLYLDFDAGWDRRLALHLAVEGAWLRYFPQALGMQERELVTAHVLAPEGRIGKALHHGAVPDDATAAVVARTLKEHTTALSLVGSGAEAVALLDGVERLEPGDAFVTGARLRLAHAERTHRRERGVELRDLLRF